MLVRKGMVICLCGAERTVLTGSRDRFSYPLKIDFSRSDCCAGDSTPLVMANLLTPARYDLSVDPLRPLATRKQMIRLESAADTGNVVGYPGVLFGRGLGDGGVVQPAC